NPAQGPLGDDPFGLALEAAGAVLVIDNAAGTGTRGALFRVDPASGARTLVSDFGNPAQGPLGDDPFGLAPEAAGTVLVIDNDAGTGFSGALFRVDRLSGQRTVVSDFGNPGQGVLGMTPLGVAVRAPPGVAPVSTNFSCGARNCAVRFRCEDPAGSGNDCSNRIVVRVRPPPRGSSRSIDGEIRDVDTAAQASNMVRFSFGVATIPVGRTQTVRLKLTRPGKRIVRTSAVRRLRGVMEIISAGFPTQRIRVRIRLR
ncbi:MAG: hypothetical protein ACREWG_00270, partial [Gammaproteobacteria bacterium]